VKHIGVYVAGPLYSSGEIMENVRTAIDVAAHLETLVIPDVMLSCFVPHAYVLTRQLVHPRTHEHAQEWDDFWLLRCDALIVLPGYSRGTEHEIALAESSGVPVFRSLVDLIEWLMPAPEVLQ